MTTLAPFYHNTSWPWCHKFLNFITTFLAYHNHEPSLSTECPEVKKMIFQSLFPSLCRCYTLTLVKIIIAPEDVEILTHNGRKQGRNHSCEITVFKPVQFS